MPIIPMETDIAGCVELSVRSRNGLQKVGVRTVGDLVTKSEEELLAIENFGKRSLKEVKEFLRSVGLFLGERRDGSEPPRLSVRLPSSIGAILNIELKNHSLVSQGLAETLNGTGIRTLGDLYSAGSARRFGGGSLGFTISEMVEFIKLVEQLGLLKGAKLEHDQYRGWCLIVESDDVTQFP